MIIKPVFELGLQTQGDKRNNIEAKRTRFGEISGKIQVKKSDFVPKRPKSVLKYFRLKYRPLNKSNKEARSDCGKLTKLKNERSQKPMKISPNSFYGAIAE